MRLACAVLGCSRTTLRLLLSGPWPEFVANQGPDETTLKRGVSVLESPGLFAHLPDLWLTIIMYTFIWYI